MKIKLMVLAVGFMLMEANLYAAGDLVVTGNTTMGNATMGNVTMGNAVMSGATITGNATVNGSLGVGTSTPTQKLDVNGNARVSGNITTGNATMGNAVMSGATITGNATVNGNLGVGTSSPTQKLDVNGNIKGTGICIGSNCTSTLHVSGGLYGYCLWVGGAGCGSPSPMSPASCYSGYSCTCPAGYTIVKTGGEANGSFLMYSCYKN